jgi:hypothetical protein
MDTKISLSVFYNGQFFSALFERNDETGYSVYQRMFAVNPSDKEIMQLVLEEYYSFVFSKPVRGENAFSKPLKNPKRRQREAANAVKKVCASKKAQMALKMQHEVNKAASKSLATADKKRRSDEQYNLRVIKRKKKHKGR